MVKSQEQREASIQLTENDIASLHELIPEECLDEFEASLRNGDQTSMSDKCKYLVASALQKLGLLPDASQSEPVSSDRQKRKSKNNRKSKQTKKASSEPEENWMDLIAPSKSSLVYFLIALVVSLVISIASFVWENKKTGGEKIDDKDSLFSNDDEAKKANKKKAEKLRQRNQNTPSSASK
jgi:hypothetical protein